MNVRTTANIVTRVLLPQYLWRLTLTFILEKSHISVLTVQRHLRLQVSWGDTLWPTLSSDLLPVSTALNLSIDQVRHSVHGGLEIKKIVFECWKIFSQVIATILLNLRKEFDISKWPCRNVLLILLLNRQWCIIPFPFVFLLWKAQFIMSGKSQGISISERFQQFCFFTKGSTLLLEKSRKINFLHIFFIEQHAKLFPFLLMLVDQVKR